MKNNLYIFNTLVTAIFIIILSTACSGNLIPVTGNTSAGGNVITLSECYQIRFLGLSRNLTEGSTTWQYQVEELSCAVQNMSEWRLEIPACATVLEASPSHWEVFHKDTDPETDEIHWKMDDEFQGGIYSIKLSGTLMRGPIYVGVNGPNDTGLIQGPVCDPNAPTPTITLIPSSPTPTATATVTSIVRTTSSPAGTPTVSTGPFPPETEEPGPASTKRVPSAPTATQTSTPGPTRTSTPEKDLTPAHTQTTPEPTAETSVPGTPTETPALIPADETPTDVLPTLASPSPTETSSDVINITDNGEILTYACHGEAVTISGNVNVVTLVGECSSITVNGNNNRVYWEEGSPVVEDTGSDNTIGQP
jgi:hypothetical protein